MTEGPSAEEEFDQYYAAGGQGLADDVWKRILAKRKLRQRRDTDSPPLAADSGEQEA